MTLEALVLVGLLAALALLAVATVAQLVRTLRRARELAQFQLAATRVARTLAAAGDPLVRDLEDLRRRSADPAVTQERLGTVLPALRAVAEEARGGLHAPRGLEPLAGALAGEVARALRSAELAELGLAGMLDQRATRQAEASTSLKRAALNLRNAIDEASRLAVRIGNLVPADMDHPGAVAGAVATASLPIYGSVEDDLPIGS